GLRAGVVNADDPSAGAFTSVVKHPLTYGIKAGDLRATNVKLSADGSTFDATDGNKAYKIKCHLPGSFNVYNSLAAIGVTSLIGLEPKEIEPGIDRLNSVE
ncbi:Mur ligase family protein, partial [Staphylococcus aureus]